ncbi:MAG TPA: hypothetical protein VF818_07445 [Ktedonobacterales bacterium]
MISLLMRLVMGKSSNSFWTGLIMLGAGAVLAMGTAIMGIDLGFFVTAIYYVLIIGGVLKMVLGAPDLIAGTSSAPWSRQRGPWSRPRTSGGYQTDGPWMPEYITGGPANQTDGPASQTGGQRRITYLPAPAMAPPGRCWLCRGKVKRGSPICLHCGAAQSSTAQESEASRIAGYGFEAARGYDSPAGHGDPNAEEYMGEYGDADEYDAPQQYPSPSGYDAPQRYASPSGYDAPPRYAPPGRNEPFRGAPDGRRPVRAAMPPWNLRPPMPRSRPANRPPDPRGGGRRDQPPGGRWR